MGSPLLRFLAWVGAASSISVLAAPNFLTLLNQALSDNFGTAFPAIPFAALLVVLFLLRWRDFAEILTKEKGWASERAYRLLGLGIVVAVLFLRPVAGGSVEVAGVVIVLAAYGSALLLNPLTKTIMLPYAVVCIVGVTAPTILQWGLGEPLSGLSSALSADIIGVSGIPVIWHGTQFALVSRTGDLVTATITPGCSSIISVTTFLGLLGLMHIDLKKEASSTIRIAAIGCVALTLLNAVRIAILIWVGYTSGVAAFWGMHNWVGYAMFLGFYLAVLSVYSKTGGRDLGRVPATGEFDHRPLVLVGGSLRALGDLQDSSEEALTGSDAQFPRHLPSRAPLWLGRSP